MVDRRQRGTRRGDISLAEGDTSPQIWDVLTRNLTWRLRLAQAKERERAEQELRVAQKHPASLAA